MPGQNYLNKLKLLLSEKSTSNIGINFVVKEKIEYDKNVLKKVFVSRSFY